MSTANPPFVADADIQVIIRGTAPVPVEFNDADYTREVLQLKQGITEDVYDEFLAKEAEKLGIRPPTPGEAAHNSMRESAITVTSHRARTTSTGSQGSISTGLTSRSSFGDLGPPRKRSNPRRSLSFSGYESYANQTRAQNPSTLAFSPPPVPTEPAASLFSVSTRRSFASIRSGIKRFRLRRSKSTQDHFISCIRCQGDFKMSKQLHTLPCLHNYCESCLRVLLSQACTEESKMPPRCCSQAVPTLVIKAVYSREEQHLFMKSVVQFSTPTPLRIFCPNESCGEFIPRREKVDPKRPFEVVCRKCRTTVCSTCKKGAHIFGKDCPADLDAALEMGRQSSWRRCYKCRNLAEASLGRSCITCLCQAEFCRTCSAIWDPVVGCPNYCNSEAELTRRRIEEEARLAELERERLAREEAERQEAAETAAAEQRTSESEELNKLRAIQIIERDRFCAFEKRTSRVMWTRHGQTKLEALDRHSELQKKMKERHARTATHLEDRQVAAEMELRATLKQSERSVQIRLRHMEAYCDGLGRSASGTNPARVVTERDLRELGQQYNVRDDLERLHQSKINVMRDKQAKQMENLLARQETDQEALAARHAEELEELELTFSAEETELQRLFSDRSSRLSRRWNLAEQMERKSLEARTNLRFAPMVAVEWPNSGSREETGVLEAMPE